MAAVFVHLEQTFCVEMREIRWVISTLVAYHRLIINMAIAAQSDDVRLLDN